MKTQNLLLIFSPRSMRTMSSIEFGALSYIEKNVVCDIVPYCGFISGRLSLKVRMLPSPCSFAEWSFQVTVTLTRPSIMQAVLPLGAHGVQPFVTAGLRNGLSTVYDAENAPSTVLFA